MVVFSEKNKLLLVCYISCALVTLPHCLTVYPLGSSTACIVNLNASSGLLRAAKFVNPLIHPEFRSSHSLLSLGDSGFCIIRSSTCIHQQRGQTHFFNCPKSVPPFFCHSCSRSSSQYSPIQCRQLAKIPSSPFSRFEDAESDSPKDADLYETKLRDGDIVILYVGLPAAPYPGHTNISLSLSYHMCFPRTGALMNRRTGFQTTSSPRSSPRYVLSYRVSSRCHPLLPLCHQSRISKRANSMIQYVTFPYVLPSHSRSLTFVLFLSSLTGGGGYRSPGNGRSDSPIRAKVYDE